MNSILPANRLTKLFTSLILIAATVSLTSGAVAACPWSSDAVCGADGTPGHNAHCYARTPSSTMAPHHLIKLAYSASPRLP